MSWWGALDVEGWPVAYPETRGLRAKGWVLSPDGKRWLRKSPRQSRPHELVVEAITLELASRFDYEVAHGRVCTWTEGGSEQRGFASLSFQADDEHQYTGAELIGSALPVPCDTSSEKKRARPLITTEAVRTVLVSQGSVYGVDLVRPFLKVLVYDAWIGNSDRHVGNWAILTRGATARFAPMYDTAGCLGAELTDHTLGQRMASKDRDEILRAYAAGCRSGFGDGAKVPGIYHRDLIGALKQWSEWGEIAPPLIARFRDGLGQVGDVLDDVPDAWLPPVRREFMRSLLALRATLLQGVL